MEKQAELIEIKIKIIEKIVAKMSMINSILSLESKNTISFKYNKDKIVKVEKSRYRTGIYAADMFLIYINNDFICAIKKENKFFNYFQSLFDKVEQTVYIEEIEKFNDILDSL